MCRSIGDCVFRAQLRLRTFCFCAAEITLWTVDSSWLSNTFGEGDYYVTKDQFTAGFTAWYQQNKESIQASAKECENLRKQFLVRFPISKLKDMTLESYAIGNREDSFCSWIENKLLGLGSIRSPGKPSIKYGVYYSKSLKAYDFENSQSARKKFGGTAEAVLESVKDEIIIIAQNPCNYDLLANTKLSQLFANKVAFLYSNNRQIPIYSDSHLSVFLSALEISFRIGENRAYKREKLYQYYSQLNCNGLSPLTFMQYLYQGAGLCGLLQDQQGKKAKKQAITMTPEKAPVPQVEPERTKREQNRFGLIEETLSSEEADAIGRCGENVVKDYLERNRKKLGIIGSIDCPCEFDDYAHYDFSFHTIDGKTIYVEVKASKLDTPGRAHFFMSRAEYEFFLENKENYWLYYVNDVFGKRTVSCCHFSADELKAVKYYAEVLVSEESDM
ncbi:MAG: DUF3883 domain-containing protein [Spirochaetaceae bacterium]|nr:DUF3883 domain-containing protein [Spirochaetaceae bacterium]